jgi:predicted nucleotidyltransferase
MRRELAALVPPPIVRRALGRFRAWLLERYGARLRELVLYGSRARGDADEDSDVDVLVVIDDFDVAERGALFEAAYDAGVDGDDYVSVSPFVVSTAQAADMRRRERRIFAEIARDGVPL